MTSATIPSIFSVDFSLSGLMLPAGSRLTTAFPDIHRSTAAKIYNIRPEDVTPRLRSSAKAINYWWGFRSDAERLDYYETLPKGTQQLLDLLEKNLAANEFPIFPAGIFAQGHIPKAPTADTYTPKELMEMDWLGECVEGSLPRYDQLDVRTLGLLEINGLSSLKETTL